MVDGNIILNKVKSLGLIMSRVPEPARSEFLKFAEEEFADDRGMALNHLWFNYKLWIQFLASFDMKLNKLIDLLENNVQEPQEETQEPSKKVRMLSGREIKLNREEKI